ncbi:MAG: TIGR04282 family arsenosugar biosynthesis glycosyltransferase [Planctomycetota bacterium]
MKSSRECATTTQSRLSNFRVHTTLGIMAKYGTPGRVKTRLGKEIGMEVAARVHCRFVAELTYRLSDAAVCCQLVATPAEDQHRWRPGAGQPEPTIASDTARKNKLKRHAASNKDKIDIPDRWEIVDQGSGDLGQRMRRWFESCLLVAAADQTDPISVPAKELKAAILIGADCPRLTAADIAKGFDALHRNDLVLGPAEDGGYYLIGLRQPADWNRTCQQPSPWSHLWTNIPWSTNDVFSATLAAARRDDLSVSLLPSRSDVDTASDLNRLRGELERSTGPDDDRLQADLNAMLDAVQ